MVTNLTFINIAVVVVRLHWFRKKLKTLGTSRLASRALVDITKRSS